MAESNRNPIGTVMLIVALGGVFAGLYVMGNALTSGHDSSQSAMEALDLRVDALAREIRTLSRKIDAQGENLAAPPPPPPPPAAPEGGDDAKAEGGDAKGGD